MQPQENLQPQEQVPEISPEETYTIDTSLPNNGVYQDAAEAAAWRDYYRVDTAPDLNLNTVSLETPTSYPVATTETISDENTLEVDTEVIEATTGVAPQTAVAEADSAEVAASTREVAVEDVIDVEAREVLIDPESLDDDLDITKLIEDNEEITVGKEKLSLTPHLKQVAKDALAFMEDILSTSDPELPPEIDWRHTIRHVNGYDGSYDYGALYDLLNAQQRKRNSMIQRASFVTSGENLADIAARYPIEKGGGAPPEQPPSNQTETNDEDAGKVVAERENLKIEMNPSLATETPQIGYESTAPALTYDPNIADQSPGQSSAQQQITQNN